MTEVGLRTAHRGGPGSEEGFTEEATQSRTAPGALSGLQKEEREQKRQIVLHVQKSRWAESTYPGGSFKYCLNQVGLRNGEAGLNKHGGEWYSGFSLERTTLPHCPWATRLKNRPPAPRTSSLSSAAAILTHLRLHCLTCSKRSESLIVGFITNYSLAVVASPDT